MHKRPLILNVLLVAVKKGQLVQYQLSIRRQGKRQKTTENIENIRKLVSFEDEHRFKKMVNRFIGVIECRYVILLCSQTTFLFKTYARFVYLCNLWKTNLFFSACPTVCHTHFSQKRLYLLLRVVIAIILS